jgi:hypothetical protein
VLTRKQLLDVISVKDLIKSGSKKWVVAIHNPNIKIGSHFYVAVCYLKNDGVIVLLSDEEESIKNPTHKTLTNCFESVAMIARGDLLGNKIITKETKITWIHDDRINKSDLYLVNLHETREKLSSPSWQVLK